MITYLDNVAEAATDERYFGLSLVEACDQMVFDVHQRINECTFDILLSEHTYLYQNGREVEYVNEAGEATKEGASIKERLLKMYADAKAAVSALWDKFINWAEDAFAQMQAKLVQFGFGGKKLAEAIANVKENGKYANLSIAPFGNAASIKSLLDDPSKAFAGDKKYEAGEYYEEVTTGFPEVIKNFGADAAAFEKAANESAAVLANASKFISNIKKAKAAANKQLDLDAKKVKNIDAPGAGQLLEDIKDQIKSNAFVCKDLIKVSRNYVAAHFDFIKGIIRSAKSDKKVAEQIKDKAENIKSDIQKKNAKKDLVAYYMSQGMTKKDAEIEAQATMEAALADMANGTQVTESGKFFVE